MQGTRFDATILDDDIKLSWKLMHNGAPTDAYAMTKVETFASYTDADAGINVIQTILPPNILHEGTGLYSYIINTPTIEGTYFDKVTCTPKMGLPALKSISSYYVRQDDWHGAPGEAPLRCQVGGYILDENGLPVENAIVTATLQKAGIGGQYYVINNVKATLTNQVGFFTLNLIRSTEFTPNVKYEFDMRYGSYHEKFIKTIPNVGGVNFIDLVE